MPPARVDRLRVAGRDGFHRSPKSCHTFVSGEAVAPWVGAFLKLSLVLHNAGLLFLRWLPSSQARHAFAIPFTGKQDDEASPSHKLEHLLHRPVAFLILPIFALANTGIVIGADWFQGLLSSNSAGIISGLLVGKPVGITLISFIAVAFGFCRLPLDLNWKHVFGAGLLGGIGFTMSIFITNLALAGESAVINASKMAILLASLTAGGLGFLWLKVFGRPKAGDDDLDAMDFEQREAVLRL